MVVRTRPRYLKILPVFSPCDSYGAGPGLAVGPRERRGPSCRGRGEGEGTDGTDLGASTGPCGGSRPRPRAGGGLAFSGRERDSAGEEDGVPPPHTHTRRGRRPLEPRRAGVGGRGGGRGSRRCRPLRLYRACMPKTEMVPVPVRSSFRWPCCRMCRTCHRYCASPGSGPAAAALGSSPSAGMAGGRRPGRLPAGRGGLRLSGCPPHAGGVSSEPANARPFPPSGAEGRAEPAATASSLPSPPLPFPRRTAGGGRGRPGGT